MAIIAQIGLGIIGRAWAEAHRSDGVHELRAWNRTPLADTPWAYGDLGAAVDGADIVHICLAGPPSVEAVLEQIQPRLRAGMLVIQSSTISPEAASRFERLVRAAGADYLEAPFTGSKPAAIARQLVFFLGGSEAARTRGLTVLGSLSRKQFAFATPEQAAAIKLAMNLQIAAITQALIEGMQLAAHHGIAREAFFEVLDFNVARSGLVDLKKLKLLNGDYQPQFSVKHMGKDLQLATATADNLSLPLPLTARCAELYAKAIERGLGDLDFIATEQLFDEEYKNSRIPLAQASDL